MARWRLLNAHYLSVPGTEWEYKETDQNTGRQVRRVFAVPTLLDPKNDSSCLNYDGECIVSNGHGNLPRDHIFIGEPTPEMEPIDDEAKVISEALAHKWVHPIDSLPSQGFSDSLLASLEKQLAAAIAGGTSIQATPVSGVDPAAFAQLQEQVAQLLARNAELETKTARRA